MMRLEYFMITLHKISQVPIRIIVVIISCLDSCDCQVRLICLTGKEMTVLS